MVVVRVVGAGYACLMPSRTIRILDLFAGAGGLTAGFHEASDRFRSVAAVELDPAAAASYSATFAKTDVFTGPIQDWLARADMPADVDVVVGGPPCQGFSALGKRDAADERNSLWRQYAEVLTHVRPGYFVVENVPAFGRSRQYQDFLAATRPGGFLEDYALEHRVLNAADYGSPQVRKRTVVIGHRRDLEAPGFPEVTHAPEAAEGLLPYRTVGEALLGVPAVPDMDGRFDEVRTRVGDWNCPAPSRCESCTSPAGTSRSRASGSSRSRRAAAARTCRTSSRRPAGAGTRRAPWTSWGASARTARL